MKGGCVFIRQALHARLVDCDTDLPAIETNTSEVPLEYRELFVSQCHPSSSKAESDPCLCIADCQFSRFVGQPLSIIYDSKSNDALNMRASRLTTDLSTGSHTKIYGDALLVSAKQGSKTVTANDAQQIDNAIHDEVMEYFCQGLRPKPQDLKRIVHEFKSGKYDYSPYVPEDQGNGGRKPKANSNMDDDQLPGWG